MKNQDERVRTYRLPKPEEDAGDPGSGGQSGDTQGLSDEAEAGGLSVKELVEEGQNFEAEALMGVEESPDPDVDEVHTKQVRGESRGRESRGQEGVNLLPNRSNRAT